MLTLLSTIFGSIFSGGATGLIGVILQRFADYKNKQLDLQLIDKKNAQELAMRDKDAMIMQQEWAGRTQVATVEGAAKEAVADAATLAESYKMEPQRFSDGVKYTHGQGWVMVILDAMRGAVRPILTVYLCVLTTLIYLQAHALLGTTMTPEQAFKMVEMIVGSVLYLTTTCVLWWFGTRNKSTPPGGKGG